MLGAPGAALVATLAHARSGGSRFAELARRGVAVILAARDADGLYTQRLFGGRVRYLGLVHGFAGNAAVLLRARPLLDDATRREIEAGIVAAARATIVREGEGASWPAGVSEPPALMQICHGPPGVVVSLASLTPLREELLAAGRAIWAAGPLAKGTNLCHGDAGNAFAFLALHAVTTDPLWLARARAFAMNATRRCDEARVRYGQGRHSLWTGDLGLAWFLAACIRGEARFPTIDFL
jgi:hypothetical protein